jgi:hypothetical protein
MAKPTEDLDGMQMIGLISFMMAALVGGMLMKEVMVLGAVPLLLAGAAAVGAIAGALMGHHYWWAGALGGAVAGLCAVLAVHWYGHARLSKYEAIAVLLIGSLPGIGIYFVLRSFASNGRKKPADARMLTVDGGASMGANPITLSQDPTDAEICAAVARWIELMARGDYASAVAAVFRKPPAPEDFRERVETFFVGLAAARQGLVDALRQKGANVDDPPPLEASGRGRVIPAPPELLEAMEIHRQEIPANAVAWIGFHLPLDNGCGIWTTMGVMRAGGGCILELEIFHM